MANYVIKEMPTGMGNGKKGRLFPKMQVYTEFDYDKVVELVHTNSPAFSQATVRGVLDTLAVVMKSYLPMGHTMKIDNLGVFSLSLEFTENETDSDKPQTVHEPASKKKYHHVRAKGVNFKVDKKLVDDINKESAQPVILPLPLRTPSKSACNVPSVILTSTASSPFRNTPTSTPSTIAQPRGNSPNSSSIPIQASRRKAPPPTKSGSGDDEK